MLLLRGQIAIEFERKNTEPYTCYTVRHWQCPATGVLAQRKLFLTKTKSNNKYWETLELRAGHRKREMWNIPRAIVLAKTKWMKHTSERIKQQTVRLHLHHLCDQRSKCGRGARKGATKDGGKSTTLPPTESIHIKSISFSLHPFIFAFTTESVSTGRAFEITFYVMLLLNSFSFLRMKQLIK